MTDDREYKRESKRSRRKRGACSTFILTFRTVSKYVAIASCICEECVQYISRDLSPASVPMIMLVFWWGRLQVVWPPLPDVGYLLGTCCAYFTSVHSNLPAWLSGFLVSRVLQGGQAVKKKKSSSSAHIKKDFQICNYFFFLPSCAIEVSKIDRSIFWRPYQSRTLKREVKSRRGGKGEKNA